MTSLSSNSTGRRRCLGLCPRVAEAVFWRLKVSYVLTHASYRASVTLRLGLRDTRLAPARDAFATCAPCDFTMFLMHTDTAIVTHMYIFAFPCIISHIYRYMPELRTYTRDTPPA